MLRQSGKRRSSATGSITAPDRICAPTSEPFSNTTTETSLPRSLASCFSRIAAARPAGPAPTITTSNSMLSRSAASFKTLAPRPVVASVPSFRRKPESSENLERIRLDTGFRRYNESWILDCSAKPGNDKYGDEARDRHGRMTVMEPKAAQGLLDWYEAMGADEAIGEAPVDRFAPAAALRPRPAAVNEDA